MGRANILCRPYTFQKRHFMSREPDDVDAQREMQLEHAYAIFHEPKLHVFEGRSIERTVSVRIETTL